MDEVNEEASSSSPRSLANAVAQILERNSIAALVTLVEARGERPVGAKLLVEDGGALSGTLGDSALDDAAAAHAPHFLASRAEAQTFKVEELAGGPPDFAGARVMFERVEPEPRLVVCGAGHVGAALARLACLIGFRTMLIDDRADFVTRERFPEEGIELVVAGNWTDAVRESVGVGRGVSVAVVTRGHNEDEECMQAVMSARPDYVGLIGSRRRTNIVIERLRESGVEEERLREIRAPVGLDIGAVSPEEVALAILAEVVSERRGGTGAPLSSWRRGERS